MDRAAFVALVYDLLAKWRASTAPEIRRPGLSPAEARAILAMYDAGGIDPALMPPDAASLPDIAAGITAAAAAGALVRAASEIGAGSAAGVRGLAGALSTSRTPAALYDVLAPAPFDTRRVLAQDLTGVFSREAERRAMLLKTPSPGYRVPDRLSLGNVDRFERAMLQAIRDDGMALAQLGAQGPMSAADIARVEQQLAFQQEKFRAFVNEVRLRELQTEVGARPFSSRQIAARARLYSGLPLGGFYGASEGRAGPGYVVDYISKDDSGTCSPCIEAEAEGPYLPGEGPMPGVVCLGKSRCRCVRNTYYDPEKYAALTGQPYDGPPSDYRPRGLGAGFDTTSRTPVAA